MAAVTPFQAVVLGIVEGLTEFLPVSSTGHLIVAAEWLRLDPAILDTYVVAIQFGAALAVAAYYRDRMRQLLGGVLRREPGGLRLLKHLLIAFLPVVFVGLAFDDYIEARFFGSRPVAWALIVGGVAMIAVELWRGRERADDTDSLDEMTTRHALAVGVAQCFSLWPGMSRSMSTIVGGRLAGLSNRTAADFTFLLALPVLTSATAYKVLKGREAIAAIDGAAEALVLGNAVAFVVGFLAIWGFIKLVGRVGMVPFGVYRIVVGVALLLHLD
ncbi:MAG: undecaprenyl-diphosphate phosphatase [Candidatus Sumerlaeia bacterium]|nr:undecaprenyl-diphosphate phosphatase [Candidatus Sumerlaeia bacterium]